MQRGWLSLWAGLLIGLGTLMPVRASEALEPRTLFAQIDEASSRLYAGDRTLGATLAQSIEGLSALLKDPALNPELAILVHYYRASARYYQIEFDAMWRSAVSQDSVRGAMAELDGVVRAIDTTPKASALNWPIIKANALYIEGSLSYARLGDTARAYQFWGQCAVLDHAGCLNIVAISMMTGEGGTPVNFSEAIRTLKRVFESATRFGCSGVSSAYLVAVAAATGSTANIKENSEIWITNAKNLLNVIEAEQPGTNRCDRLGVTFADYLIGMMKGRPNAAILDRIAAPQWPAVAVDLAAYLKGSIDDAAIDAKLSSAPPRTRCIGGFFGVWRADIAHRKERARQLHSMMLDLKNDVCTVELALLRNIKSLQ